MKPVLATLVALILCLPSFGQKQGNIWFYGEEAGLDFNSGNPVGIQGGKTKGNPQGPLEYLYSEGTATIADSSGQLLFYSNGEQIWNNKHQPMPNGSGLMGMYSSTHAAFILPVPGSDSLFYVFTTDGMERGLSNGLRYNMVDMCLDSGRGDVISGQKNILLLDSSGEKLAGALSSNGVDYWLVAHKHYSDEFYSYKVSASGISNPVISKTGTPHDTSSLTAVGQMKISSDGKRLALAISNLIPAVVEVFDFNSTTGVVSNPKSLSFLQIGTGPWAYGIEFSPDGTKLYASGGGVRQYDLTAGSGSVNDINASMKILTRTGISISSAQLGPDGKIYTAQGVVHQPNDTGIAANFVDSFNFNRSGPGSVFPSFVAGYHYGNGVHDCSSRDTSVVNHIDEVDPEALSIYPNPANEFIVIESNGLVLTKVQLLNIHGASVHELPNPRANERIAIGHLDPGIYFIMIYDQKGVRSRKVIVN